MTLVLENEGKCEMLKARGVLRERETVFLGLSYANLQKFKDAPLNTFILISKDELDMPFDILIFSGKTEEDLERFFGRYTIE